MGQLGFSQAIEVNPWDAAGALNKVTAGTASAPLQPTWVYKPVDSMYSASMSSALRMKNGNTLIHEAFPGGNRGGKSGSIREVDPAGKIVGTKTFFKSGIITIDPYRGDTVEAAYNPAKIMYYPPDHPGILKVLAKSSIGDNRAERVKGSALRRVGIVKTSGYINFSNVADADIAMYTLQGAIVASVHSSTATYHWSTTSVPAGTYMVKVRAVNGTTTDRAVSIVR